MSQNKNFQITCITCPIGCRITIDAGVFSGNKCQKGALFAEAEMTFPVRSLTTTVKTIYPNVPVLPVRTKTEVPKDKIPEIMRELSYIIIEEEIGIGEIVVANILETGCDIIATSNILRSNLYVKC